jgi:hypothetical protein
LAELIPWNRILGSGKERANLGGVDELVGETLGDGLDVPEGRLPRARAQQPDGLKNNHKLTVNIVHFLEVIRIRIASGWKSETRSKQALRTKRRSPS